ncbi:Uncharacterised protein [Kocuria rosea]|nr:hypothetical protein FHX38_1010 [Kocuria rosea]VEI51811.1 Uncharacterised protein [Kocuria rosea]
MPRQPRKLTKNMKLLFIGCLFVVSLIVDWALDGKFSWGTVVWAVVFTALMSPMIIWWDNDGTRRKKNAQDEGSGTR